MSRNRYKLGRVCSTCGTGISDKSTTGVCKPCFCRASAADPELRRRRSEALKRRCARGGDLHAQYRKTLRKARDARDPEMLKERGLILARNFPAHEEKRRAAHVAAMRKKRHQWLPDEYRNFYYKMIRSGGFRAPQAKRIILDQIAAEKRRLAAALSQAIRATNGGDNAKAAKDAVLGSKRLLEAMKAVAQ